jgi:hypothetical protein
VIAVLQAVRKHPNEVLAVLQVVKMTEKEVQVIHLFVLRMGKRVVLRLVIKAGNGAQVTLQVMTGGERA